MSSVVRFLIMCYLVLDLKFNYIDSWNFNENLVKIFAVVRQEHVYLFQVFLKKIDRT